MPLFSVHFFSSPSPRGQTRLHQFTRFVLTPRHLRPQLLLPSGLYVGFRSLFSYFDCERDLCVPIGRTPWTAVRMAAHSSSNFQLWRVCFSSADACSEGRLPKSRTPTCGGPGRSSRPPQKLHRTTSRASVSCGTLAFGVSLCRESHLSVPVAHRPLALRRGVRPCLVHTGFSFLGFRRCFFQQTRFSFRLQLSPALFSDTLPRPAYLARCGFRRCFFQQRSVIL